MDFVQRNIAFLGADWTEVGALMRSALRSDIRLLNETNDAILSHGGKMLRPAMSLLVSRAVAGTVSEGGRKVAGAAELLHNATLLHDDVADASPERRGVPTTSSLLGDRAAVLLGDYWLVKAVDMILDCGPKSAEVIRIFAKTLSDLASGEMLQLQKAMSGDTTREDYLRIIYSKTASLFEASCVSAALCAGASEELVEAARTFGVEIGMAFQIKDDILDYTATDALGKPVGIDLREKKITLPLLGALSQVSPEREAEIRRMVCAVDTHPAYCDEIHAFVLDTGGVAYAEAELAASIDRARAALDAFPQGEAVALLGELADFIGKRDR